MIAVLPELEQQMQSLERGDHLCLIYADVQEQLAAVLPFMREGLRLGEQCLYIADEHTVAEVRQALEEYGVEVGSALESGQLSLLTKQEVYLRSGVFDPHAMVEFLREAAAESTTHGYPGFRVTGEMVWALGPECGCDRLIEYEARVNQFLPKSKVLAICQYNRQRFSPEIIYGALRTHPKVVVGGAVCPNPFHEPPDMVLEEPTPPYMVNWRRVDWMISQLQSARHAEQELRDSHRRLRVLCETAIDVLKGGTPQAFISAVYERLQKELGLEVFFHYQLPPDGEVMRLMAYSGVTARVAADIEHLPLGQAVCGLVAQHQRPIIAECIGQSAAVETTLVRSMGITAYACHPLMAGNQMMGTLSFGTRQRDRFGPEDIGLLRAVSDQVAVAVERWRLETELAERAARLAEADRRKDEFLAMLAHELRNPLAPIRNAAEILRQRAADERMVQRQRELIERNTRHLTRLVDDLLEVSRITEGKIELRKEPTDLVTVVEQAVANARASAEERGHALAMELPEQPLNLDADPTRLAQVLSNLLNNAAKYTAEGGSITVTAFHEAESAVLRIRDTGRGIDPQLLPQIFDLFVQGRQTLARTDGGLGIGLTLVKRLVELHGGSVEAHSSGPGLGSEFVVRLPAHAQHPRLTAV